MGVRGLVRVSFRDGRTPGLLSQLTLLLLSGSRPIKFSKTAHYPIDNALAARLSGWERRVNEEDRGRGARNGYAVGLKKRGSARFRMVYGGGTRRTGMGEGA